MLAAEQFESGIAIELLDQLFTAKNSEGIYYQTKFNEDYTNEEAEAKLTQWLSDFGLDEGAIQEIQKISTYPEIANKIQENQDIVENQLKPKGIPTIIYEGKKHTGLFKL